MKELVSVVASTLVDDVNSVRVNEIEGNTVNTIELRVGKDDVRKVIGRQGRTADAIRTILSSASVKISKRYALKIIDNK